MAKRPNFLFFFTDDQRFDTVRALGNAHIITPTLDRLVQGGTAFTNAYIMGGSCGAVCMPSRAMLMTGRSLFRLDGQGARIPAEHGLLGEVLRRAGYVTFGTGKWHNGPDAYARSFSDGGEIFFGGMDDHWNVPACRFDPTGRYPAARPHPFDPGTGEGRRMVPKVFDHVRPGKHSSELFCDAAVDFLQRHDGKQPFFLYVSFMAPHDPRTMPRKYLDLYPPEPLPLPPNFLPRHPFDNGELDVRDERLAPLPRTPDEMRRHLAAYYAMITHADAQMARVLAALAQAGHADDTVVVFSGDNGLALGQHGLMGKQSVYEHSVHVPLVLSGPGVPRGERRDAFCTLVDLLPTLCEMADVPPPKSAEGRSLLPVLRDPGVRVRDRLFFAYRHLHRSVRDERFKLIEYVVEGQRRTQLFDLSEDPFETENLVDDAASRPVRERLRRELVRWRTELADTGPLGRAFWGGLKTA